jgi:hypothetical protein
MTGHSWGDSLRRATPATAFVPTRILPIRPSDSEATCRLTNDYALRRTYKPVVVHYPNVLQSPNALQSKRSHPVAEQNQPYQSVAGDPAKTWGEQRPVFYRPAKDQT